MARKQAGPRPLYLSPWERHIVTSALHTMANGREDPEARAEAQRLAATVESPTRKGHHLVRCEGEAHSNPHIDNCSTCAPRWGWCEVPDAAAPSRET